MSHIIPKHADYTVNGIIADPSALVFTIIKPQAGGSDDKIAKTDITVNY